MSLAKNCFSLLHRPLRFRNRLLQRAGLRREGELRVLLYHDIAPWDREAFRKQIRWLGREWQFVSPEIFCSMISGGEPIVGKNLLITFDDGFASNRWAAEQVLSPMGIKGLFFIPSDFPEMKDHETQRLFIANCICSGRIKPGDIPPHLNALSWEDLSVLLELGHSVGSHTRSHRDLSLITEKELLREELSGSREMLEKRLGVKMEHFAYPFGTIKHINEAALAAAREEYRFIHSAIRGGNSAGTLPWAILRDNFHPSHPTDFLGTVLEGGLDWYYRDRVRRIEGMVVS